MLEPRKNPLIDQPLVAASALSFRRARIASWVLFALIALILVTWIALLRSFGQDIYSETWWRQAVSNVVNWQFQKNLVQGRDSRLSEQVQSFESERVDMQSKIQNLEKLVQGARMDGWLRTFSARRNGSDDVDYEVLLTNPRPGQEAPKGSIAITVRGIDKFDPQNPEVALTQSAQRFRAMRHKVNAPEIAEAIKGRLNSRVSNFMIVTAVPFDDPTLTEVAIIPITTSSRSN